MYVDDMFGMCPCMYINDMFGMCSCMYINDMFGMCPGMYINDMFGMCPCIYPVDMFINYHSGDVHYTLVWCVQPFCPLIQEYKDIKPFRVTYFPYVMYQYHCVLSLE